MTVCVKCGSNQVSELSWVDCNSGKITSCGPGEYDDKWCESCEDHTEFKLVDDNLNKQ